MSDRAFFILGFALALIAVSLLSYMFLVSIPNLMLRYVEMVSK